MARLYVFVYPFAMKYVWILVVVVLLVRIDLVLKFFDKTSKKIQNLQAPEINSSEIVPTTEIVTMENDLSLRSSPKKKFFSMLSDFHARPDAEVKTKILEFLHSHPTLFTDKLDQGLENSLYQWRDLLVQKNKLVYRFLMDFSLVFKGENLEMLKRLMSFIIDNDLEEFLMLYSKSSDTNCTIISYLGDPLSDDEKFNELSERLNVLETYLASDKVIPANKIYGEKCLLVLKLAVDKMRIAFAAADAAAAKTEEAESQTTPVPAEPATEPPPTPVTAPDSTQPGPTP
jgi:hypothetical protein